MRRNGPMRLAVWELLSPANGVEMSWLRLIVSPLPSAIINSLDVVLEIPAENTFTTWEEAARREKFADAVVICTQVSQLWKELPLTATTRIVSMRGLLLPSPKSKLTIIDTVLRSAQTHVRGYHILLEKPMASKFLSDFLDFLPNSPHNPFLFIVLFFLFPYAFPAQSTKTSAMPSAPQSNQPT